MKLKNISTIRTGLVLSRKQADNEALTIKKYNLLTLRSIDETGQIDITKTESYNAKEILNNDFITKKGDIIVRLSVPYTAVLIDNYTENLVISSHFVIIRVNYSCILPEYLYWLLNTDKIKNALLQNCLGSSLAVIKPSSFGEIEIYDLPLEKQRVVGQINLLGKKEIELLEKLKKQKEKLNVAIVNQIQKELRSK